MGRIYTGAEAATATPTPHVRISALCVVLGPNAQPRFMPKGAIATHLGVIVQKILHADFCSVAPSESAPLTLAFRSAKRRARAIHGCEKGPNGGDVVCT
eukprot:scaffold2968_cov321-Pinguiococcus_pyrenoidosus.AAC.13